MQKDCRKRFRANGAMVDAGCKPFEKHVNATNTDANGRAENDKLMKRANNTGSIISGAFNSSNWYTV